MKPVKKIAFILPIAGIMLTGCTTPPPVLQTVTVTKIIKPDIPPQMLACMPAPTVPVITATDPHGGSKVAALLVREAIAGQDCRLHVNAIRQALDQ